MKISVFNFLIKPKKSTTKFFNLSLFHAENFRHKSRVNREELNYFPSFFFSGIIFVSLSIAKAIFRFLFPTIVSFPKEGFPIVSLWIHIQQKNALTRPALELDSRTYSLNGFINITDRESTRWKLFFSFFFSRLFLFSYSHRFAARVFGAFHSRSSCRENRKLNIILCLCFGFSFLHNFPLWPPKPAQHSIRFMRVKLRGKQLFYEHIEYQADF